MQVTLNENEEHFIVLHENNFHSMFPLILHFFPCGPQAMILHGAKTCINSLCVYLVCPPEVHSLWLLKTIFK